MGAGAPLRRSCLAPSSISLTVDARGSDGGAGLTLAKLLAVANGRPSWEPKAKAVAWSRASRLVPASRAWRRLYAAGQSLACARLSR